MVITRLINPHIDIPTNLISTNLILVISSLQYHPPNLTPSSNHSRLANDQSDQDATEGGMQADREEAGALSKSAE